MTTIEEILLALQNREGCFITDKQLLIEQIRDLTNERCNKYRIAINDKILREGEGMTACQITRLINEVPYPELKEK